MSDLTSIPATKQDSSRSLIKFEAEVDWHERHRVLKFEVPLDIRAHEAIYETQFGHISRPTHKNTTWVSHKLMTALYICLIHHTGYGKIRGVLPQGNRQAFRPSFPNLILLLVLRRERIRLWSGYYQRIQIRGICRWTVSSSILVASCDFARRRTRPRHIISISIK
jgi:hypothetical protein